MTKAEAIKNKVMFSGLSLEPAILEAQKETAIAFADWLNEECSYAGSGFYIHISTLRQYKLEAIYDIFNNETNQ